MDAPPTIGGNLQRAIDEVTQASGRPSRVTHQVHSHSHSDHIGASVLFGPDVVRIGHNQCRTLLLRDNDPNRPAPTVTFDDRHTLSVGGQRLELIYHGPNHSQDNIFIWAPEQQALMLVDVVFPGWVPWQNLAVSQDIPDWIKAQDLALSYPWRTLCCRCEGFWIVGSRPDLPAGGRIGDFTIITKRDQVRQSTHRHAVPNAESARLRVGLPVWLTLHRWDSSARTSRGQMFRIAA